MYWRLRDCLEAQGKRPLAAHRLAVQAGGVGLLSVAFEREVGEIADFLGVSTRTVERGRKLLRASMEYPKPRPRPIPRRD